MNQKVSISKKEERRYKREAKVESKRALVAQLLISQNGRSDKERDSLRTIAKRHGKSHMWVVGIIKKSLIKTCSIQNGEKYTRYKTISGYKESLKRKKPGPRPGKCSQKTEKAKASVLATKKRYPHLGAAKIKILAGAKVSTPTVHKILLNEGYEPVTMRIGKVYKSFEMEHPNDMWQIDYVELGTDTLTGRKVESLSIIDDHSRFMLSANARISATTDDVLEFLEMVISIYGAPKKILSDHGTQWASNNGGDTRFDEWCKSKGIIHIMGQVRKPTTQGKVERYHGNIRREADLPEEATVEEYQ